MRSSHKMNKRISANYVRKFLPSLRRESTPAGRKWTLNGETYFNSLQDVIDFVRRSQTTVESRIGEVLNAGAEKEIADVSAN